MRTFHIIPNVILLVSMLFSIHATSQFSQQAKIVSPDRESRAEYGTAADIRGNYAIVGSPRHNIAAGAAYIYEKNGEGQWEYLQPLIADDALEMAEFGGAVKMTEDYIVVASGRADIGSEIRAGALYVYNRSGQTWDFSSKIVASNYSGDDKLGMNNTSIDAQGDIIVGGAPGANGWVGRVYVFERSEEVWNEVQIIENPANTNDTFGISVALSGDVMVIGANESNGLKGSAYIYYKDSNGFWVMQQQITASDSAAEDFFGTSVSVDGESIVVGAYGHQGFKGAAYIFKKDSSGVWIQSQKLISSTQIPEAYFGWQCEIQGTNLIVGAPHIYASTQGEVFIFKENGDGEWIETQLVQSEDISAEDFYGWAVALFEDQIVVGAPWEDEDESGNNTLDRAGSAYIFKNPTLGTPYFSSPAYEVVCYPNPADNIFIIEGKTASIDRIKIYGINGILLQELYMKGGKTAKLHIQDLAKGVYLVQIDQQGGFSSYQKMVKQ